MLFAHDDVSFPYRRQLLLASICALAVVALLIPADSLTDRAYAAGKVIGSGAIAYAAVFLILELLSVVLPWLAKFYALFCYYGGILGVILTPLIDAFGPHTKVTGWTAFTTAGFYAVLFPQIAAGLCAAAVGYKWWNAPHAA
jgi:hypothetical protein